MNLSDAIKQVQNNLQRFHVQIAYEFMYRAQGYTPVDTGNLRASWYVETNNPSNSVIINAAEYAVYVHNGTERQRSQPYAVQAMKDIDWILKKAYSNLFSTGPENISGRIMQTTAGRTKGFQ